MLGVMVSESLTSLSHIAGKPELVLDDQHPAALKAFELQPIAAARFGIHSDSKGPASGDRPTADRITCSVPFELRDGRNFIALGSSDGVWIGLRGEAGSLRLVLHVRNVTQCALLPESDTFLVLADKELWAYDMESMVPSSVAKQATACPREKLNKRDAFWFRVGHHNNRTLLVYMTQTLLNSVCHVLELVVGSHELRNSSQRSLRPSTSIPNFRFSTTGKAKESFRPYAECQLPSGGDDMYFVNNNLMVMLSARGFEMMNMVMDATQTYLGLKIPVLDTQADPSLAPIARRIDAAKPLGIFQTRTSDQAAVEFLLCYDDFGLYVDSHGRLSRTDPGGSLIQSGDVFIEWEGPIERVACHPPYVLLVTTQSIQVRLLESCKIIQFIPVTNYHAVWDESNRATKVNARVSELSMLGMEKGSPDAPVHIALREVGDKPPQEVLQVYELLPRFADTAMPI